MTNLGVLVGNSGSPITGTGFGSAGQVLTTDGSSTISFQSSGSSGAFSAYVSSPLTNATGDGTIVAPIVFDTVQYNIGSWYDPSTGIATIPSTGAYQFVFAWGLTGVSAANVQSHMLISNVTASFSLIEQFINPFAIYDAIDLEVIQVLVANAQCTAGDQIQCSLAVSGGTKSVTIWATGQVTAFSGFKIA